MDVTNARFVDEGHTLVALTQGNSETIVPADERYRLYRELINAGTSIAPYADPTLSPEALKQAVNSARTQREAGPFTVSTGHSLDASPDSQTKLASRVLAIQTGMSTGPVYWRMADDVTYEIAPEVFTQIAGEVSQKIEAVYAFSWQLKADIDAGLITTPAEIEEAPWPS
jgi:hypothetical protein